MIKTIARKILKIIRKREETLRYFVHNSSQDDDPLLKAGNPTNNCCCLYHVPHHHHTRCVRRAFHTLQTPSSESITHLFTNALGNGYMG